MQPIFNRVVQITRGAQTVRQLTYDNAGNLITDSVGQGYAYNNRNRLSQATVGALVYNYTYNALEQLAIRTQVSPASTTHFIHDRMGNVIAETAGGGPTGATGTTREYIWLPETEIAPTMGSRTVVDRPLAVVDAVNTATPVTYWVSVDHLNRPIQLWNAAKSSVWQAVWLPWGGVQSITGTLTLNARLPGQWYQLETGLHYNWHRHYDPTLGRYIQPDPLGFVDGPSVYGYAGGSPFKNIDPRGLMSGPYTPIPVPNNSCPALCPVCRTQSGRQVLVNTLAFRFDRVPPSTPHFPCTGDNYNMYKAQQIPKNCHCFWQPIEPPICSPDRPPPTSIEIEPFNNVGPGFGPTL